MAVTGCSGAGDLAAGGVQSHLDVQRVAMGLTQRGQDVLADAQPMPAAVGRQRTGVVNGIVKTRSYRYPRAHPEDIQRAVRERDKSPGLVRTLDFSVEHDRARVAILDHDASLRFGLPELIELLVAKEFSAYGPSHWAVLAVFVVGAVLLVWLGHRQTESSARWFGRIAGALTAAIYLPILIYPFVAYDVVSAMPLQLTDLATVTAAYALWSQRHWAYALTYYWGLVLSVQALISPALRGPDFPSFRFLAFWSIHLVVVWAAIYLTWGRGMRPHWRDYLLTVLVTLAWAAITFTFNSVAGTDYGFLNGKPATVSLLDVLGPWPLYLVPVTALVITVWALMTWPWERVRGGDA